MNAGVIWSLKLFFFIHAFSLSLSYLSRMIFDTRDNESIPAALLILN